MTFSRAYSIQTSVNQYEWEIWSTSCVVIFLVLKDIWHSQKNRGECYFSFGYCTRNTYIFGHFLRGQWSTYTKILSDSICYSDGSLTVRQTNVVLPTDFGLRWKTTYISIRSLHTWATTIYSHHILNAYLIEITFFKN